MRLSFSFLVLTFLLFLSLCKGVAQSPCLSSASYLDDDYNLMFVIENVIDNEGPQYLMPIIEKIFEELKVSGVDQKPRFSTIDNLNELQEEKEMLTYIERIGEYYSEDKPEFIPSPQRDSFEQHVFNRIKNYHDFLVIKIYPVKNELVDYHFIRYTKEPDSTMENDREQGGTSKNYEPIHKKFKKDNVIINLGNDLQFIKKELTKSIKEVFCETNIPPQATIEINHPTRNDSSFVALGDSILLKANIEDPDSRIESMRYQWRQVTTDSFSIPLKAQAYTQTLIAKEKGCFEVGLYVFDGRSYAETEDTLTICLRDKPEIKPRTNLYFDKDVWLSEIEYKRSLFLGGKYVGTRSQIASGVIMASQADSVELSIGHSETNSLQQKEEIKFFSLRVDTLDKDLIKYYERKNDYKYSLGLFYDIFPKKKNADPTQLKEFDLYLRLKPSPVKPLAPGIYHFDISAKEKGLESGTKVLKTKVTTYSISSFELALGSVFINIDSLGSRENATYALAGFKFEIVPYMYLRTGTSIVWNNPNMYGRFHFGFDADMLNAFMPNNPPRIGYNTEFEAGITFLGIFNNAYADKQEYIDSQGMTWGIFSNWGFASGSMNFRAGFNQTDNTYGKREFYFGFGVTYHLFRKKK